MKRILLFFLMVCIVAGGQALKPKAKTISTKTTQVKSQKSQSSQSSQSSQKSQQSQSSQKSQQSQSSQKLKAEKRQLQKNIAANKTKKAELEKKVKEQLEAVLVLGDEINEKQRTIDTIRVSIDSLDAQLLVLEGQLKNLQDELSDRQQRYAQSVRFMHRNNKMQSKMMFIFSAKNINQMYRRTRFIKEYATYQRAQGEAVKQKQKQVEQKQQELESSKAEKTALLTRGEREQQDLETQQNNQQKMADELRKQQKTVAALIAQQQQQEADLNKRIDQMIAEEIAREQARLETDKKRKEQEEQQRKARLEQQRKAREKRLADAKAREEKAKADAKAAKSEAEKAKAKQMAKDAEKERKTAEKELAEENKRAAAIYKESKSSNSTASSSKPAKDFSSADPDARLSGSFASNKGRLPMPITGAYKVVRGFGSNVVDGARGVHLSSKGIYLKGQPGAQARCIFDGEVSKIYSTGSSYIVMVRHGRYISVYSDLVSISVKAGQRVSTNQTLGNLGPSNTMQFQLRNWTELLNPRSWLKRK